MAIGYNIPRPRQMTPEEEERERQRLLARDTSLGLPGTADVYTYGIADPTGVGRSKPGLGLQYTPARGAGGGIIPRTTRYFMEDLPPGFQPGESRMPAGPGRPLLPMSAKDTYRQNYVRTNKQSVEKPDEKGFFQNAGESLLDAAVRNLPAVGGFFVGGPAGAAVGKAAGEVAGDALKGEVDSKSVGKAVLKGGATGLTGGADQEKILEAGKNVVENVTPAGVGEAAASLVDDAPEAAKQAAATVVSEYGDNSSSAFRQRNIDRARRALIERPDLLDSDERALMESQLPGGQRLRLMAFNRAKSLAQSPGMTRRLIESDDLDKETRENLAAIGRAAISEYDLFKSGDAADAAQRAAAGNLDAGYGKGLVSPFAGQLDYQDEEMREFYEDLAALAPLPTQKKKPPVGISNQVAERMFGAGRLSLPAIDLPNPSNTISPNQFAAQQLAKDTFSPVDELLADDGGMAEALAGMDLEAIAEAPRSGQFSPFAASDDTYPSLRSVGAGRPSVPDAVLADRGTAPAMVSMPDIPIAIQTGMNVPDPQARILEQAATPSVGSVVPGNVSSAAPAPMVSAGPPPMSPLEMARMRNTTPVPAALPPSQQPSSPFAAFPSAPPEPAPSAGFSPFGAPDDSYAPLESVGAGRPMGPLGGMADRGTSPAFVSPPPVNVAIPTGMNVPQSMPAGRRGAETMLDVAARNTIAMNPQMQAQVQQAGPGYGAMYGQMQQSSNQGGEFSAFDRPIENVPPPQSVLAPGIGRINAPMGGMAPYRGAAPTPPGQGVEFSAFDRPIEMVPPPQSVLPPGIGRIDAPMGGMAPYSGAATQPSPELFYTDQDGNVRDRRTGQIVRAF